jgi:hypothetical protein
MLCMSCYLNKRNCRYYEKKVQKIMVNNATNINKRVFVSVPSQYLAYQRYMSCFKYQMSSSFPWCNLHNMNKFGQWSFLYSTIIYEMWRCNEGLNHDCQQFHQYQQNKQTRPTSKSLITINTRTHNVGNQGTGLGQTQTLFCWY